MSSILRALSALTVGAAILAVPAPVSAHEVTYHGTVVALKMARYAQPGGGTREVPELEVAVVDAKTKKVTNRVFVITAATKVTRAGKSVTVAAIAAQARERVAVVVDHDKPGDEALRVRFEAAN